jgi:cytochrome c553
VAARYSDGQFERAIRHAVDADGHALAIMPSDDYNVMSQEDMGDLLAYLRSLPPVNRQLPPTTVRALGRALYLAGELPLFPAERIDHAKAPPPAVPAGVTVAYGEYLATIGACKGCHGPDLAGHAEGQAPGEPPAANLTPVGRLGHWSEQDFFHALRTGIRPDGTAINAAMPWAQAGQMTDDEIRAVWMYLKTVPPKQTAKA